ncbi:translation initiation factor [Rhodococcus sp. 05-2254-5]|uniref:translation initiation factor n=1 Tax=unclassified Rhodococcus (in: high G+C Gram-positive bacteria) TaxID=192944 RepID=UPI000B9A9B9F|nr:MULTISPECIES: translation initiation factor [unclassified Rhodococcus (in: high G+C Gram-positive bacteria)]OZE35181.1 translation initiation factor [Rhodococcus sp. 05-2254-5]OZE61426.1 translation initiation factor [Rhodococcus sp. 05-2254-1]
MPPRGRAVNDSLTPENLTTLAAALAEGRRATVYLREPNPSLGLPDGTSAKVVSIDGNTVTISPKGVNDELPYEAEELRITRNPASPPAPAKRIPAKKTVSAAPLSKPAAAPKSSPSSTPTTASAPTTASTSSAAPKSVPATDVAAKPAGAGSASTGSAPRRPKKAPGGVSVTIHAGADNDWSVTVTQGAKRPTKAQPVSPEAVGRAVRELGDVTARDAVEAVISHAREEAARRVAELSRQLDEARTTLAALEQDV